MSGGPQADPVCQWTFNRACRFHHIGGDSLNLFKHPPAKILHRHVSVVDDADGSWAARLARIFSGKSPIERWVAPISDGGYVVIQIPIPAAGVVKYAAGFAFRDRRLPTPRERDLMARAILRTIEAERARTAAFLHDTVAQYLSSAGIQLELLQLELAARKIAIPSQSGEIQRSLEEALQHVRKFSAKLE